jgi:ribosomal protein S21
MGCEMGYFIPAKRLTQRCFGRLQRNVVFFLTGRGGDVIKISFESAGKSTMGGGGLQLARERYDEQGGDPRREFERAVRRLKKDFQRNVLPAVKNVLPAVKRHRSYVSKSEMKRIKERKAARRRRRQLRKFGDL